MSYSRWASSFFQIRKQSSFVQCSLGQHLSLRARDCVPMTTMRTYLWRPTHQQAMTMRAGPYLDRLAAAQLVCCGSQEHMRRRDGQREAQRRDGGAEDAPKGLGGKQRE